MKHFLFLVALSLMCACSFHETEHLEQNHSSTFEQELKMFYDKQNSMWNKFVIHALTRSSGLNEDLGLDDFMNDETFQQIQEDLLSFCEDHQDILK